MQRGLSQINLLSEPEIPADGEANQHEPHSYLEMYGFARAPFAAPAGEREFVLGESHRKALEALAGAMIAGKSGVALTGDPQIGKTTLLNTALTLVARRGLRVFRAENKRSGPMTVDRLLGQVLGMTDLTTLTQMEQDRAHGLLTSLPAGVSHSVLVIDDAETLAASALRYLTKLCRRGGMGGTAPQIVLIGAPAMWPLLRQIEHRRLADRIGVRLRINRLTTSEARLYIERRLWVAGSETRKVLSPAAFAEIVARTEGIPGRINAALERVFAAGFEQGHARVTPQTVRSALGITRPPTIRTKASAGAPPIWLIAGSCLVVGLGAALYANSDSLPSASDLFARFGISLPTLFAPASTGGGKP